MVLSDYQSVEFLVDDSGSMSMDSDTINPVTRVPNTRWQEAHQRLKEMIELMAYVPLQKVVVEFLNRPDRIILIRNRRAPRVFLAEAYRQIDTVFVRPPHGTTPAFEKMMESFQRGQGVPIVRYFLGDGQPDGGDRTIAAIVTMLRNRPDPFSNPVTFLSCTGDHEEVKWMKEAEEVAPYCSKWDNFRDELRTVLGDQGEAFPYTRGFWLICQLVAALNPFDLDAMDESVPFTKSTFDQLLGIQHNEQSYRHYFNCFVQAKQMRKIERDWRGRPNQIDSLKRNAQWNVQDFLRAPSARQIPQVQQFLQMIAARKNANQFSPPSSDELLMQQQKQYMYHIPTKDPSWMIPENHCGSSGRSHSQDCEPETNRNPSRWLELPRSKVGAKK